MSIFEDARVTIVLADHIGIDLGGKANLLGAGFTVSVVGPQGLSAPQHMLILVDLPSNHAGAEFALSAELKDETLGAPFKIVGPNGSPEVLRIQQIVRGARPSVQNAYLPLDLPVRVQLNISFANGLPLVPGHSYLWKIEIDGQHRKGWETGFHVLGPPPAPVFGGPSGPADLPQLGPRTQ